MVWILAWVACTPPTGEAAFADADLTRAGVPRIQAPELVQGKNARIEVAGLDPGTTIRFYASDVGEGSTAVVGGSVDLEQPWLMRQVRADNAGRAGFVWKVKPSESLRPILMQGVYHNGRDLSKTRVVLRNVTVPASQSTVAFVDATEEVGIGRPPMAGNSHTGGAAWVDVNGDHWPDLFVTNGAGLPHRLYRNNGDGSFTDISDRVPKPDLGLEDAGVAFADLENDGDLDIFVPVDNGEFMSPGAVNVREGGPNLLYVNDGAGNFTEAAGAWNAVDPRGYRSITGAFADVDRDGFVDLYLGTWAMNHSVGVYDRFPLLLGNDGGFGFVDRTAGSGLDQDGRDNLVAFWFDPNEDGWPDLYQGNVGYGLEAPTYDHTDGLYVNDGTGAFVDAGRTMAGFGDDAGAAMGADIGDVDGDGYYDLYITDIFDRTVASGHDVLPAGNVLYRGQPDGTLADNTCDVARICTGYIGWPANFADFDRDGWVDLWVGNSNDGEPELLFVNQGDGTFNSHDLGPIGENDAHGGTVADYDGDGDIDVFIQNSRNPSTLLRNEGIDAHHYVAVKLFGTMSNAAAIGADVRFVTPDGQLRRRRVSGGDSAHSQQDLVLHVGLGDFDTVDVTVVWPSGHQDVLGTLSADTLWFVEEGTGVLQETLTFAEASVSEGWLAIVAKSRFGGRTALSAEGLGELSWDPEIVAFVGIFAVAEPPAAVVLSSSRGGAFVVPVP